MMGVSDHRLEYVKEGMNRPTKFTPERRAAIIDAIARRAPHEMAAEANGICLETFYAWLRIAKTHQENGVTSDYTDFSEGVKSAELKRMLEHSDKIASNVERWQADAWILERRWHKHYGANAQLNELNEKLEKLEKLLNKTGELNGEVDDKEA